MSASSMPLSLPTTTGERAWGRGLLPAMLAATLAACVWFVAVDVVVASVGYIRGKAESGLGSACVYGAGHVAGAAALVVLAWSRRLRQRLAAMAARFESPWWVLGLIAVVAVVRLVWIVVVRTPPYSDGRVYDLLAWRLVETGVYATSESRAYWPPGYPFWLAGLYAVFGHSLAAAKIANVVLAAGTELLAWVWVKRYAGRRVAAVAVVLLVVWPSRTLHLDILSYDDLVTATVLLSLVLMPDVRIASGGWWRWLAAGAVLGLTCFVRSTLALVVPAVVIWMLLARVRWTRIATATALCLGGLFAVLSPWMVRNYLVFDQFVPLTTNAGGNFYHSVCPGSDGGFYRPAEQQIQERGGIGLENELNRNAVAFEMALETIRNDPALAIRRTLLDKPVLYLGSDNCLAWLEGYEAVWPESPATAKAVKASGLFASNSYYVVLMLCPLLWIRNIRRHLRTNPAIALMLLIFLSGFAVHSVFQAQPRYHLIYTPFWSLAIGMLLCVRRNLHSADEACSS